MSIHRIAVGHTWHTRYKPKHHHFRYRSAMCLFDLDQLTAVDSGIQVNKGWLLSFRTHRYLCSDTDPSGEEAREFVKHKYPELDLKGKVLLLTNPRLFGVGFNPLSIYFLHDSLNKAAAIIYEVSNTPWNEFHRYVLPAYQISNTQLARFDKKFHVSPFNPMSQFYETKVTWPYVGKCSVYLSLTDKGKDKPLFEAGLHLAIRPKTPNLRSLFIGIWPQTLLVVAAIYKEAFALWRKGLNYHAHP